MGKLLRVLLVILFGLMVLATLMCAFDCIIAHRDEAPTFLFSFLLPLVQEEFVGGGRVLSLGASVMLPGLAVFLPAWSILLAAVVRWRSEADSRWRRFSRIAIIVSSVLYPANLYSVYTIYRTFASI